MNAAIAGLNFIAQAAVPLMLFMQPDQFTVFINMAAIYSANVWNVP